MLGENVQSNIISSDRIACHSRGMDFATFNLHFTYLRTKIVDKLGLSYHSTQELNGLIDTELPGHPHFQCETLDIRGEELEFHYRDVLECI